MTAKILFLVVILVTNFRLCYSTLSVTHTSQSDDNLNTTNELIDQSTKNVTISIDDNYEKGTTKLVHHQNNEGAVETMIHNNTNVTNEEIKITNKTIDSQDNVGTTKTINNFNVTSVGNLTTQARISKENSHNKTRSNREDVDTGKIRFDNESISSRKNSNKGNIILEHLHPHDPCYTAIDRVNRAHDNAQNIYSDSISYHDYTLYNVLAKTQYQLRYLQGMQTKNYIKFWRPPYKVKKIIPVLVHNSKELWFRDDVAESGLFIAVIKRNVQELFDMQKASTRRVYKFDFSSFHSLDVINEWMRSIVAANKEIASMASIGQSTQGREIYSVSVKRDPGDRRIVIVEGGTHSNEWISVAFVLYLIDRLIHLDSDTDRAFKTVAESYHWYLVPVLNPDGYEYSYKTDRLWRKNRKRYANGIGVDLNRNYAYSFGVHDTGVNPTSELYPGPGPFSEAETKALADLVLQKKRRLHFFFSIHGFGQMIIVPYSDTRKQIENYSEMENYGKQAALKIYSQTGKVYIVGNTYETTGRYMSGDAASWVKKNYRPRYVLTFHLRDNGTYGHAMPGSEILPSCREFLSGLSEIMTTSPRYISAEMFSLASDLKVDVLLVVLCCLLVFM